MAYAPSLPLDKRYVPQKHVVSVAHGDETVLLDVNRGYYYVLNNVGGFIWSLLFDQPLFSEICDRMVAHYEADPTVISTDAERLISELLAESLVAHLSIA